MHETQCPGTAKKRVSSDSGDVNLEEPKSEEQLQACVQYPYSITRGTQVAQHQYSLTSCVIEDKIVICLFIFSPFRCQGPAACRVFSQLGAVNMLPVSVNGSPGMVAPSKENH